MANNQKISTADVLARIKAKINGETKENQLSGTAVNFAGSVSDEVKNSHSEIGSNDVLLTKPNPESERRASLNIERASGENIIKNTEIGAHLLSKEVENTILNRCAPNGAVASGESGLLSSRLEHNAHAPVVASQPEQMGAHSSLTPIEEEVEQNLVSDFDQDEVDDADEALKAAARAFDPNLYEVRLDLYDNDQLAATKQKKGTRFRVALDIRSTPTKRMNQSTQYMLDFYNRTRDVNKRLTELQLENDPWYEQFKQIFEDFRGDKSVTFQIKPLIAVAKKLVRDGNKRVSQAVPFFAAIFYQIANEEPKVMLLWGVWNEEVTFNESFKRTKESALWKKGRYLDETRIDQDIDRKQATKLNLITTVEDI
ncbi:MAG: hypothetical protein ACODTL_16240 [Brucella sp.]